MDTDTIPDNIYEGEKIIFIPLYAKGSHSISLRNKSLVATRVSTKNMAQTMKENDQLYIYIIGQNLPWEILFNYHKHTVNITIDISNFAWKSVFDVVTISMDLFELERSSKKVRIMM